MDMDIVFEQAGERAVLEAFHRRGCGRDGEALQLGILRDDWAGSGLRAGDLGAALNRLSEAGLIETRSWSGIAVLALTRSGQREVDDCFGRGRCNGENWMAEVLLNGLHQRVAAGSLPALERRAA